MPACGRRGRTGIARSRSSRSFVAGRLTKEELDLRVGQALVTPFFAELMALTADLPVGPFGRLPAHPVTPAYPRLSRLAIIALVCAMAGPLTAGITAVPAIVGGAGRAARSGGPASGAGQPPRRR